MMTTSTKPQSTTHPCGCQNEIHEPTGALRRVSTCQRHTRAQRSPESLGLSYYTELGMLRNGMLQPTNHVAELTEALGPIPDSNRFTGTAQALEIGCGVSPYAEAIISEGWHYLGIEPSKWACGWMRRIYGVEMLQDQFERLDFSEEKFGLILAAHSLEHLDNAPGAIARCAELLAPGGQLWIVIPDDADKTNPDHKWCFDRDSLWYTVESAGLTVEKIELRRHVATQNFLYCRARKPGSVVDPVKP